MSNYSADVKARSTVTETELTTIPDADARITHLENVVLALAEIVDGLTEGNISAALATYATSAGTAGSADTATYATSAGTAESADTATYATSAGTADTATTAETLGTATVGSGTKPIYLSSGTATASSSTVGSVSTPVFLKSGTITACSYSLSSSGGWTPAYSSMATRKTGLTYTASTNGYIMFYATAATSASSEDDASTGSVLTIGGTTVTLITKGQDYLIPVGSGQSYIIVQNSDSSIRKTYYWIPCS